MIKKTILGGIVVLGLIIFGFVSLLRTCLSKYDERSMTSTPLLFQQNGKSIIFSLVKFDQCTSYNQNGGFISKSVSTTYSIQTNDAATGEKLQEQNVKKNRDIKSYPVEIIGSSANRAWLFVNELMAFDPFTLEKVADISILETKNPSLKGKFSKERKYYELDEQQNKVFITTIDGSKYQLDTKTLLISPAAADEFPGDPFKTRTKELAEALKKIQKIQDEAFQFFRDNNKAYSQKILPLKAYRDSMARFERERARLDKIRDSIYALQRDANEETNRLASIKNRTRLLENENNSFSSIRVNTDTFLGKWYGLYTANEVENTIEQFDYRSDYNDAARNKLYTAGIVAKDPGKKNTAWIIAEEKESLGNDIYIQGGFLMEKQTGLPIHLSDQPAYLIAHKEAVGNDAIILISKVDVTGKKLWTINTGLKNLAYWAIQGNRMIITGIDNKELSSGQNNVLHTIDLKTGSFATYDFFNSKMRSTK